MSIASNKQRSFLADESPRGDAEFSPCGLYRYALWRNVDGTCESPSAMPAPSVNFLMLNPSTADASVDDPTIRRCIGYAKWWGFPSLIVTNLFAFRATDPRGMHAASDPIGPLNDEWLIHAGTRSLLTVAAWGTHGGHLGRSACVRELMAQAGVKLHYLKLTKAGQPSHPLYLPADLKPEEWTV